LHIGVRTAHRLHMGRDANPAVAAAAETPIRLPVGQGEQAQFVSGITSARSKIAAEAYQTSPLQLTLLSSHSQWLIPTCSCFQFGQFHDFPMQDIAVLSMFDRLPSGSRRLLGQLCVAANAVQALQGVRGCFKVLLCASVHWYRQAALCLLEGSSYSTVSWKQLIDLA
jgi:hypothetical protein